MVRRRNESRLSSALKRAGNVRILIAITIAIGGGWLSVLLAVSGVTRTKNPEIAIKVVPIESNALANRADHIFFKNSTKPSSTVTQLARKALEQQAINPKAVRLLGYAADAKGDKLRALALVKMAERLSRREPGAQLWQIEHYAQANDNKKTLHHYDILLTTKPDTHALLFPRLSNAIEDASVRAALIPYLKQKKQWMNEFLWHSINNDKKLSNVVNLIVESSGLSRDDENALAQQLTLLGRLVSEKQFDEARRIYTLMPNADVTLLANPAFVDLDREARFGVMGWQIHDDPNAGGVFAGEKDQGPPALTIFTNPSTTRTVASRLMYLRPGSYLFRAKLSRLQRGDGGYIRIQMRCPTNSGEAPVWVYQLDRGRLPAPLEVPTSCPVQFLDIVGSGGVGQIGMEADIHSIAIVRKSG